MTSSSLGRSGRGARGCALALSCALVACAAVHTGPADRPDAATASGPSSDGDDGHPDAPDGSVASLALGVPCLDDVATVYVTPPGLPPIEASKQGDIVRCHRDVDLDLDGDGVDHALASEQISIGAPSSGVDVYRVAFRTRRGDGVRAAASSARVYVPRAPRALPLPVVVVGHPTEGVGDACAPSKSPKDLWDVALPWAARGYAVIAPDYSGLGNENVQAYLDNREQGFALLDGARALRKLLPNAFDDQIVIAGYSQGGGAALSAQALARTYGAGGTLVAVIAFAPEWPIRDNSFALADLVRNPAAFVAYDPANANISYSNHAVWAQRAYGFFANLSTLTSDGGAAFPPASAGAFLAAMDGLCGGAQIGGALYVAAHPPFGAKNGDLFEPGFRAALAACLDDPTSTGCTGLGQEFHRHMRDNVLTADPAGAPVLYVQGLADTVLPPTREGACIVDKLTRDGVVPQLCVDLPAQHTDVTNRNIRFAIDWFEAKRAGAPLPACPTPGGFPIGCLGP